MLRAFVRFSVLSLVVLSFVALVPPAPAGTVVRLDFNYSTAGSSGTINYVDLELFDNEAPITVANFLKYVNNHLFDNSVIHRNAQDFVVQGGGYTPTYSSGNLTGFAPITSYGTIQNEFSSTRSNVAGTIAMAKLSGNPNSATHEWFVNLANNSSNLDNQNGGFTVFGRVIGEGMKLFNAINSLPKSDLTSSFGSAFNEVPLFNSGSSFIAITRAAVLAPPVVAPTGSLAGYVYVDMNHNGVKDAGDYAIADARVTLTASGTPVATVASGADGAFRFGGLGANTYSIKMQTPTYAPNVVGSEWQIVLDKDGKTIISTGAVGTASPNAFSGVALGSGQAGLNFNFGQSAYPVALISARMLLNTSTGAAPVGGGAAIPGTNAGSSSTVNFGNVLVGTTASTPLNVNNLGSQGSALTGTLPAASGEFGPTGTLAFGPLAAGATAAQTYTYTPANRGADTQNIAVATSVGNLNVTLSGKGVAPVRAIDSAAAVTGAVRIGTTGTASVKVSNVGDGNLSGAGQTSNLRGTLSAGSGNFSGPGGDVNLADGASQSYSYTYTPTAHTFDSVNVSAQFSNGSANGANAAETVQVAISGWGVGPIFTGSLSPGTAIDFGTVPQASTKSMFLDISNTSTDVNSGNAALTDLTLLSAQITGADGGLFSVVGLTPGAVLHQGDHFNLEIAYNGTGAHGDRSALLTITTDEGAALGASGATYSYPINVSLAPEPGALALLAMGGLAAGGIAWRRRKKRRA